MDTRTSKFSEEQMIGFVRQAETGMPIEVFGQLMMAIVGLVADPVSKQRSLS